MTTDWWPTTKVRQRSLPHVETERLLARLAWLDQGYVASVTGEPLDKNALRARAWEATCIMRELVRRGVEDFTWSRPLGIALARYIYEVR